jgi:FKBP-type peptidyl-prolyl cis-trans isomerase
MKASYFLFGAILAGVTLVSCDKDDKTQAFDGKLDSDSKKFSYALGMEIGTSLKNIGTEIDFAAFVAGAEAIQKGETTLMSDSDAAAEKNAVFTTLREKKQAKVEEDGQVTLKVEKAFLDSNKTKEGVISLPSGLQYKVIREGTGPKPKPTDKLKMNYRGTLMDGTEFDNSQRMGVPAVFDLGQIIPGMSEGLKLMKTGGKYQMWIPSALAYGSRQMSNEIKPYSTLIFEVELLEIIK